MADSDVTVDDSAEVERKIDTRTVGAGSDEHRQVFVVGDPATAAGVAAVTAANGVAVDVTRLSPLVAGTAFAGKMQLTDGTDDVTVSVAGSRKPLDMHLIDSAGNVISTFGGAGGTSATDDADFTPATTPGTPMMGAYQTSVSAVTDTDLGIIGIDDQRRVKVTVDGSTVDVAHDAADSGNPVKIGTKARNALPTAVANGDRADAGGDLFGRLLVAHVDPAMVTHKATTVTSTQTGGLLWDPAAGKKIAVTSIVLGSYGVTAARCIIWFGDTADVTYTAATDQVLVAASFAPSTTAKPGLVYTPATPVFCTTADRELKITTDAALSLDITVEGYEF